MGQVLHGSARTTAAVHRAIQSASKSWGSRRQGLFLQLQTRIPAPQHHPKFPIEGLDPRLQEQMRPSLGPLHLLLLQKRLLMTWLTVDSTTPVLRRSPYR
jgi:hypothetical protein